MSNKETEKPYPDIITRLPRADIPFEGIQGWLAQGNDHQVVFFDIQPIGKVTEHIHGAQWGIVVDGEMDLTIGGINKTYKKGDSYFIPAGVPHSAEFKKRTLVLDFFADKDRYRCKTSL